MRVIDLRSNEFETEVRQSQFLQNRRQIGKLKAECGLAEFQTGKPGGSLREAYLHCSQQYFPPSGRPPGEELFTLPQFNTWIEFT